MGRRYWLFKSEPDVYSFDDLIEEADGTCFWEGVRNYQARNFLRDEVKQGDRVFFYHSRVKPMAIVGTAEIVREGSVDPEQFDPKAKYFDPKSDPDNPRWYGVHLEYRSVFKNPITLQELKGVSGLEEMVLLRKGSRLSIQPVSWAQWKVISRLGGVRA